MTSKLLKIYCLVSAMCAAACTSLNSPDVAVSEAVIDTLVPVQPEQPWRLNSAWQSGGLAGAVLRSATIEHVVSQVDQSFRVLVASDDVDWHDLNVSTQQIPEHQADNSQDIQRAWRKYCHHQLDMTPEELALVRNMAIPQAILSHGCNPGSLSK